MPAQPIVALMYDFDKTLSPRDMQEYAFIPCVGMDVDAFWQECLQTMLQHNMDQILAYMYVMLQKAGGQILLNRNEFRKLGRSVALFPGVATWFGRVNRYAAKLGLTVEHYIISSGLKEIIEGTKIAPEFKAIYAAEFLYDGRGVPVWPAMAVNYTSKTQFLFRINKGILGVTENKELNEFTPENKRRIPFSNMVYIGDGLTDVPCMKLTKVNGGHSIAVYQGEKDETVGKMLLQGRVDYVSQADYTAGGPMETIVRLILDHIAPETKLSAIHTEQIDNAQKRALDEGR
ncbi:MAG: haloacid dehalogenase-like hydrolase [Eubacteriales bacterium]|nr:haloacid dehalogenase-like hydrolase [Eubacteriales bacterium]